MDLQTSPQGKLRDVTSLVDKLSNDLENPALPPNERINALEKLKIYGRDPRNADPIFTEKGISMLLKYGFDGEDAETARAALRVLANSMLLKPQTRQMFVNQGFGPKACLKLQTESWDDEFLVSRVLFLSTYGNIDMKELIEKHKLAERIAANLAHHEKELSSKSTAVPMEEMALVETLKLLFNVTHFCESQVSEFTPAVPHVVALLWKQDIPRAKPLDGVLGSLVNALLNLDHRDETSRKAFYPESDPTKVSSRLIEILDVAIRVYSDNDLEAVVASLINVIRKVHEQAPEPVKQSIRDALLPTSEDREQVLGKGDTLSAKLLQNSTNPICQKLRDSITQLLFDMSDRDASRFVENVGYGIASGFLFQNNIPVPDSASEAGNARGTEKPVNPITGQFLDAEKPVEEPEMTQEEKEREAERLFVLFERLKATGVMNVENPVHTAMREGRYRELRDDEVEELP